MMSPRRTLAAIGIGGVLAATSLAGPEAHATPLSYLQALNDRGMRVYDTTAALRQGYSICAMLNQENGEQVAMYVFTHTSWSDVPDMNTARILVVTAVEELCPEYDHRGQGSNASGELSRT